MEMLVAKFSKGKYANESELFEEPISAENVKLMGEMIALQALRTVKKYDMKIADKLYIGLIKDLHHMGEIDYIVSDGYDCAQTAMCFLYQFIGRNVYDIYGKDRKGIDITIKLACYREIDKELMRYRRKAEQTEYIDFRCFGYRKTPGRQSGKSSLKTRRNRNFHAMIFRGSLTAASFSDVFSLPKAKLRAKKLKINKKWCRKTALMILWRRVLVWRSEATPLVYAKHTSRCQMVDFLNLYCKSCFAISCLFVCKHSIN